MDNSNIKVYLAISGALIFLLILIIIIPFSKKSPSSSLTPTPNSIQPTSVKTDSAGSISPSTVPVSDFTGAVDEPIPQTIIDRASQKKDLQSKVPLELSTFSIDFDYGEDKFIVTLKDPKDQAQKEFESWKNTNYPGLGNEQFLFR